MGHRTRPRRRALADRVRPPVRPFPVDVEDRGEDFVVSASLPGLHTQDIDVAARKSRVRIDVEFGADDTDGVYHRQERTRGHASRVVHLPLRIDERHVRASYLDGVLRVTLRKRRPPRRVPVE